MGWREQLGAYLRDKASEFMRAPSGLYVPSVKANQDLLKNMGRGHFEKYLPWIKCSVMQALYVAGPIGPVELERTTALVLYQGKEAIQVHLAPHEDVIQRLSNFGLLSNNVVVGTSGNELQINGEDTLKHIADIERTRTENSIHVICMNAELGGHHMDTDRRGLPVPIQDEGSIAAVMERRAGRGEMEWLKGHGTMGGT